MTSVWLVECGVGWLMLDSNDSITPCNHQSRGFFLKLLLRELRIVEESGNILRLVSLPTSRGRYAFLTESGG